MILNIYGRCEELLDMRKRFVIIWTLILTCLLSACTSNHNQPAGNNVEIIVSSIDSSQPKELIENLSQRSLKEEQDFVDAEVQIRRRISANRYMIDEFNKVNNNGETEDEAITQMFSLVNEWISSLNFSGYRSTVDIGVYPMFFMPDDYYMFQQMIIETEVEKKLLEYNVFFVRDFEKINMERYALFIKGIYNVDITSESLKNATSICQEQLASVTQDNQFDYILYEKNKILIKMVAMEDVTGDKYIAICCRYMPES
jgi:hypothetical protein